MRVGLVVYDGFESTTGGYRYDRKLAAHLRDRGDEVSVLELPRRRYPLRLGDATSRSLRERLNRPFDVLVQDELCHASLWRHNRRLDRPGAIVTVVHHLHSAAPGTRFPNVVRAIEGQYLRSVDGAVCVSTDVRDRSVGLGVSLPIVVPPGGRNGGRACSPQPIEARSSRGPLRICFVGNVVPRKGVDTLLSALATVEDCQLTVAGSLSTNPAYARSVIRLSCRLGLEDRVTFRGPVDDEELCRLYDRSHVLALPSRYEAFGMVTLEAMEHGVVAIASANGGADDVVVDGKNGFLVAPDDVRGLADALTTLADDRDRLATMGRAALRTADVHPPWETSMGRIRSYCAGLANVSPDPGGRRTTGDDRRPGVDRGDDSDAETDSHGLDERSSSTTRSDRGGARR